MSQEMQEIRQVMTWDTTDAESGAVRMERAFERISSAEKRQVDQSRKTQKDAQPPGGHGGHGGHGAGDFGMGVHDFLMGRQAAAMFRFGNAAKLAGVYAVGMNVALEAGGKAFDYAQAEIEKTATAADRLEQSFLKVSKAATFATVGEGSGKLGGTIEGLQEQFKGEKQQQKDLGDQRDLIRQRPSLLSPAGGGIFPILDWWQEKRTGLGVEGRMEQNRLETAVTQQEIGKVRRLYGKALGREAESAHDRMTGDTFEAQRRDLDGKEESEIADARSKGLINGRNDPNEDRIRQKYAADREASYKAERGADRQLGTEGNLLDIRRRGGAVETASARVRLAAAEAALQNEVVGTRGWREKSQARDAAQTDVATTDRDEAMRRGDYRRELATAGNAGNASSRSAGQAQAEVDKAREHLRILQTTVGVRATEKELNEANLRLVSAQTAQALLQRQQYQQRADLRLDDGVARFGGNEDQRAAQAAQAEVTKAQQHLDLVRSVKGANEDDLEVMQAKLEVSKALLSQELQRRQQLAAQRELASALRLAPGGVAAAGARLDGASPDAAEGEALEARRVAAGEAYENARRRAVEERGSVAALQAQAAAAKDLADAEIAAGLHQQQVRRERAIALESARGQTASLRLAASGRDDLAELASQRTGSDVAIKRANLAGHPEEAAELAEQQRLRERKSVHDLYLHADGTRRLPYDVQKEMHDRVVKQTRVAQFDRALDRNGGLMSVHRDMAGRIESGVDPLTGHRLNAREIAQRNAAAHARVDDEKDAKTDHELFTNILKILTDRLPKDP